MQPPAETGERGALAVVLVLFVANGLVVGLFGGSLPGLRAALALEAGHVVGLLVAAALSSVVAMNLSGRVADRRGAWWPALVGAGVQALGAVVLGTVASYPVLLVGAVVFGLGNGAMDVAMNALGVGVEQTHRRPVMSRLHAGFSAGNLGGALLVVGLGRWLGEAAPRWSLWSGALLVVVLVGAVARAAPDPARDPARDPAPATPDSGSRARSSADRVPTLIWLLAAMAVCFGLTEGTAIDWSSLHVTDVAGVSPSSGAWGLACVSGFMVLIRLFGDAIVARVGRSVVARVGSGCALGGYLLTALTDGLVPILVGWSLVGLGVGLLAPQIYGLAGHAGGGQGLATVVSFGYAAFLVGPAVIGFVAGQSDLQRAMLVPVVSALGLIALSARLPADPVSSAALEHSS